MREVLLAKVNARIAKEESRPQEGPARGEPEEQLDATGNSVMFNQRASLEAGEGLLARAEGEVEDEEAVQI